MIEPVFQYDAHQFLRRGRHVTKALPERDHRKTVVLQSLHHHRGVPAVIGDFANIVALTQITDEFLNETIVNDIAFGRLNETLPLPLVVHHVIPPNAQCKRILRQPEKGQHHIGFVLIPWWENQHQRRQVGGGGKVEPGIAGTPFQLIWVDNAAAFVPFVHGHPAHRLFHPLIQAQLAEHILVRRCFQRLAVGVPYLVDGDRIAQGRIALVPVLFVLPVRIVGKPVDYGVKARIVLASFQNIQRFLMHFPADRIAIRAGCGQEKPQGLLSGVAAALSHHVIQGSRGLRVELIKDTGRNVQTMLGRNLRGKHLINAARGLIHHASGRGDDLDQLAQRGILLDHIDRHVKHNGCLLTVAGAGVNLRFPFVIVDEHIEGQRRAQLGFSVFLADLNIHLIVLPHGGVFVPDCAEYIADNLFLPGQQLEGFPVKFALRMSETLNKADDTTRFLLVKHHPATRPSAAAPWDRRRSPPRRRWRQCGHGRPESDRIPWRRTA